MGWFSTKSASPTVEELVTMSDADLSKIIGRGKVPQKSAKELRKAAKDVVRKTQGEKGLKALTAGAKGGGSKNYQNIPLEGRVHPAEAARLRAKEANRYARVLEREARKQGLL